MRARLKSSSVQFDTTQRQCQTSGTPNEVQTVRYLECKTFSVLIQG